VRAGFFFSVEEFRYPLKRPASQGFPGDVGLPPPPRNLRAGRPPPCCGAATWSPTRAHPCPHRARARVHGEGPPPPVHPRTGHGPPRPAGPGYTRARRPRPGVVGMGQRVARATMHAVPALPAHGGLRRHGRVPPRFLPFLADDGGSSADSCGPGPGRPAAHAATPSAPQGYTGRPLAQHRAGVAHHVRGRGAQPGPRPHGGGRGPTQSPALGHRPDSPASRATSPCSPKPPGMPFGGVPGAGCRGGPTGSRHVAGRLRPYHGPPSEGPPKLVETPAAGVWEEVPGVPGPAWRGPHRRGDLDHADR